MLKKSSVILIGICIVAVSALCYVVFVKLEPVPPVPPPVNGETSDWKTYRNEEFGFEIKLPDDWTFDHDSSFAFYDPVAQKQKQESINGGDLLQGAKMEIYSEKNNSKLSLKKYIDVHSSEDMQVLEEKEIVINNIKAIQRKGKQWGTTIVTYLKKDNIFCMIVIYINEESSESKYIELYNQILSTFKFVSS